MREALTLSVGDVAVRALLQIHAVLGVAGVRSCRRRGARGRGGLGVGDARVEDGVMRLPRYCGPHGDAWTSALKKRRALGLRTAAQGWRTVARGGCRCSVGLEEVDGTGFK